MKKNYGQKMEKENYQKYIVQIMNMMKENTL